MALMEINGLSKHFSFVERKPGFRGALESIFAPIRKEIKAVETISFSVHEGEIVAFMGPNGAGKSTTIKMLTGILTPTNGSVQILGLTPWENRQKLSYSIGTVFGQKSQLWFHLPAMDSFELMAKIYEIPNSVFTKRRDELIERFDAQDFVNQPVRKLSLGQRMKCELIASLLHSPKILFLDEPTIGLDLIAKRKFREEIKKLNEEDGVTIFLTSHDVSDIEKLCKRIMVINHGQLIYDESLAEMKRKFFRRKTISVLFDDPVKAVHFKNVQLIKQSSDKTGYKLEVDTKKVSIRSFLSQLSKLGDIMDITIEDPPVEELIEQIYRKKH